MFISKEIFLAYFKGTRRVHVTLLENEFLCTYKHRYPKVTIHISKLILVIQLSSCANWTYKEKQVQKFSFNQHNFWFQIPQ